MQPRYRHTVLALSCAFALAAPPSPLGAFSIANCAICHRCIQAVVGSAVRWGRRWGRRWKDASSSYQATNPRIVSFEEVPPKPSSRAHRRHARSGFPRGCAGCARRLHRVGDQSNHMTHDTELDTIQWASRRTLRHPESRCNSPTLGVLLCVALAPAHMRHFRACTGAAAVVCARGSTSLRLSRPNTGASPSGPTRAAHRNENPRDSAVQHLI